jgi:hypothetical protein
MASNFWGIPRLTHDVDILVVFAPTQVPQILNAFSDPYYVSENAVKEALSSASMFNVIDPSTSLKADMWVFKDDAFNRSLLDRRQRVETLAQVTSICCFCRRCPVAQIDLVQNHAVGSSNLGR